MVPGAEPGSYHGRPVLKEPVWTWEIPLYLFAGGLAGGSAGVAWLSELRGNEVLARRAWAISAGAVSVSPALLVSDLGRPARFMNMLRMFKVTSPMSVGSWVLAASGATTSVAALNSLTGALPGPARLARPAAAALGMPLSSYTGALVANTAIPVWHEARYELPFLFAGGAAASAGAAASIATPVPFARPARRAALFGAALELGAAKVMEARLGELGEPYRTGAAGKLNRISDVLVAAGGVTLAALGGRRGGAVAGGGMLLAGAACKRWAVFRAGFQSAADPRYAVAPQRERVRRGESGGAELGLFATALAA
jgi:hypothetical protein